MKKAEIMSQQPAEVRWPSRSSKSDCDKFLVAVLTGDAGQVKKLNSKGISINILNQDGQTPLFCAAFLGKTNMVKLLLSLGANPNCRCQKDGYTAMHGASYTGNVYILKLLLETGGDLRLTDTKRQRPLDWVEFQPDLSKRQAVREFIEGARFCTMQHHPLDLIQELESRIGQAGGSNFGKKVKNLMAQCTGGTVAKKLQKELAMTCYGFIPTGFGRVNFGTGTKCADAVGLPYVSEVTDLRYDADPMAPSWICGKFSTFIPMTWTQRNTSVTLKALRKKSVEEAVPDILIAELETLTKLHHPSILMLLAVCQEENFDSIALVFEKVKLGSLYFFLHNKNLRMKSACVTTMVIQISEALDYIHGSGFIHAGISSHSIMLVSENQAKLSCFEYAVQEDTTDADLRQYRHPWLHSDSHLSILRHWIAPEILADGHQPTQTSDVYSLCCVMWELIFGEVPWKDHTLYSLRELMIESPGIRLPLHKNIVPQYWYSLLSVGLRPKWEERDLDFGEIRYMMTLAKDQDRPPTTGDLRQSISKLSLKSMNNNTGLGIISEDTVDAHNNEEGDGDKEELLPQPAKPKSPAPETNNLRSVLKLISLQTTETIV